MWEDLHIYFVGSNVFFFLPDTFTLYLLFSLKFMSNCLKFSLFLNPHLVCLLLDEIIVKVAVKY